MFKNVSDKLGQLDKWGGEIGQMGVQELGKLKFFDKLGKFWTNWINWACWRNWANWTS